MLDDLVVWLIGDSLGEIIGRLIRAPFVRHKQRRGSIRSALKLETGAQEGLTTSWCRGDVILSPGCIEFGDKRIEVQGVSPAPRQPDFTEQPRVHVGSIIYSVVTPTARLLWAVPSGQSGWALRRLARGD